MKHMWLFAKLKYVLNEWEGEFREYVVFENYSPEKLVVKKLYYKNISLILFRDQGHSTGHVHGHSSILAPGILLSIDEW